MATRQTAGKSAKGGKAAQSRTGAARKPGVGSATRTGGATPRTGATGSPAQAKQGAAAPAATGLRGAWLGLVGWAGGGLPLSTLIISVLGVADSTFLVYQHFSQAGSFAFCSDKGGINCEAVTTSAWSYLPAGPVSWSAPVSVLGLAFFLFMLAVNSPWGWRARWPVVHWARLVSVCVGIVMVLYLVWAELFRIDAICLYCTGVHILTFALFALVVGKVAFSGVTGVPARR